MPVIANKRKMARYRSRPRAKLMNMAPEKMSAWKERRGELGVTEASETNLKMLAEAISCVRSVYACEFSGPNVGPHLFVLWLKYHN